MRFILSFVMLPNLLCLVKHFSIHHKIMLMRILCLFLTFDHYARQEDANGIERRNSSSLFEEQTSSKRIKEELSSNGADSDIEFVEENSPDASNLRKIRNALMTVDTRVNLKVESDECNPPSPTSGGLLSYIPFLAKKRCGRQCGTIFATYMGYGFWVWCRGSITPCTVRC